MLEFAFMQRTLVVGFLLGIMIPLIGVVMVNRKTSMMGDALSHTSLAGVGLGLILGINPTIGAAVVCVIAAFSIEAIRKRFPEYGDMSTAVIMSMGLGFAAILSDFAPGGNSFESYLFGSISSSTPVDVFVVSVVFVLIMILSLANYAGLLAISIDTNLARLSGINVRLINGIFTFLTAITVALSCKIVGALLVASLLVLPTATALLIARSYKQVCLLSVFLGVLYMMTGLTISWYLDIKPGGAIILLAIVGMIITSLVRKARETKRAHP